MVKRYLKKVGFKFVFIYPAFYVDTSYSYLLPKYKRISVYLTYSRVFSGKLYKLFICFRGDVFIS